MTDLFDESRTITRSQIFRANWFTIAVVIGLYVSCFAGLIGSIVGIPKLFRDFNDFDLAIENNFLNILITPVAQSFFCIPFLVMAVWAFATVETRAKRRRNSAVKPKPVSIMDQFLSVALLSLLTGILAFTVSHIAHGANSELSLGFRDVRRATAGLSLGLFGAFWMIAVNWLVYYKSNLPPTGMDGPGSAHFKEFAGMGILSFGVAMMPAFVFPSSSPPIVIYIVVCVLALLIFFAKLCGRSVGLILFGIFVALAIFFETREPFTFRFANITSPQGQDQYLSPIKLPVRGLAINPSGNCGGDTQGLHADCPVAALAAWRAQHPGEKRKLILLATSGGAYRAAFWTALVLDDLVARSPKIADAIRLITGASGGMVGAAYFVAHRRHESRCSVEAAISHDTYVAQWPAEHRPLVCEKRGPCGCAELKERISQPDLLARNSLAPIILRLFRHDIFQVFASSAVVRDRGRTLEEQWPTLEAVTFDDLRAKDESGARVSVIISPTLVETGQPLWISDLRLGQLRNGSPNLAAEFFDWFPGARKSFRLSTAVRMSASFPYVTPTAALPTEPRLRVVDAGYYDNFGMSAVNAYLRTSAIRDWILDNTSGVIIIQLRAFRKNRVISASTAVERAVEGLITPVEGLLAARDASMRARNTSEFGLVRASYHQSKPGFVFETVEFVNDDDTSLSWYLTQSELNSLRRSLRRNEPAFKQLKALWRKAGR